MQTLSHAEPINLLLADAFSEFIAASARLERSYVELQGEVSQLTHELAERNAALNESLAENERVHAALAQIVDSMPCGVMVAESSGTLSLINLEALQLLGLTGVAADHLSAISAVSGLDLEAFIGREGLMGEQEFSLATVDGPRWISVRERGLLRDGVGQTQTILILRDITLHKQAEQERERARRSTALAEIAATLAHEIRNPLMSLELFAGLIVGGDGDVQQWAGHLQSGIRSLAAIVNNVLSFSGSGFPAMSGLDLTEAIRSSVDFARPLADEAGIAVCFSGPLHRVDVVANGSALQQLVMNLIGNAVRHTAPGGSIRVTVRAKHGSGRPTAVVEFRDTGCGIAAPLLGEIFSAGFSGSGTTSGLGLAVCQQIAAQHDAGLTVESTPGVGTMFALEMPTV